MVDIKTKLNPSQFASVTTIDGPILVIAGAGSGKTRAIEYRVTYMVEKKIDPASILLLTFTKRAAHEMLSRASRHDVRCRHVEGGTFHSFAFKALKKYAKVLGLAESFSILDEGDSEEAIHRCAARMGLFNREVKHPKKDTLRTIISMSINKGISISHTLEKEYPHFLEFASEIERLRKEYDAYKINKNYLDYDDLLIYLRMLLEIKELRGKFAHKYRYIMVDEYQDTNAIQGDIAYLLAEDTKNIMVVGDDAQSIYGFRGSSHKNIMEFPKRFKECRIIKLEENYRSTQSILDVANAALENMDNKYSKCLVSARKEPGARPRLNYFKNQYDEAEWIVAKIKESRGEGLEISDQAVLFRSAYTSIPLQAELGKNGIPFQVFGGLKFYETAHVKDVISHLKIILNPKDEIAWNRALTLLDGIGPKTADKIIDDVLSAVSISDVIERFSVEADKPAKHARALGRLKNFLKSARAHALHPGALYDLALDYYTPLLKEKFDDWHLRSNDLEALRQISSRYDSLEELLGDFAIEPPERGVAAVAPESKNDEKPLVLSTIHSAKGLEWDTVYIIGLMDGALPISFALNDAEDIEEESRLLYVAITRAKNSLYLSLNHEGTRGGITQFNKLSRFIDTPNVLSCLNQKTLTEYAESVDIDLDDEDDIIQVYDKETLLRKRDRLFK